MKLSLRVGERVRRATLLARLVRLRTGRAARAVVSSRWFGPIAKVAIVLAGLFVLAFVGRSMTTREAIAAPTPPMIDNPIAPVLPAVPTPASSAEPIAQTIEIDDAGKRPDPIVILNEATLEELERLPGIGTKKAQLILALRQRVGRFRYVEDLLKVKGIGRKRLAKIRPLVRLDRD